MRLVFREDGILCVSGTYHSVDFYGYDGAYKYSYVFNEEIEMYSSLAMDESGTVYAGLPYAEKVLEIKKVD